MRARISGGIAGWLIGAVPLIVVNILDYQGLFALQDANIAGLVALIGGIGLGGVVAGLLGGRGGGTVGATASGAIAAILYAMTLIGLMIGTVNLDTASPVIAMLISLHPLRVGMALLFLAAVLLAIAIATGAIFGRRASDAPTLSSAYSAAPFVRTPQAPYDARRLPLPSRPQSQSLRHGVAYDGSRTPSDSNYDSRYGAGTSRPLPPDASDPRYATSRSRTADSSNSRRDDRPPSRDGGRR